MREVGGVQISVDLRIELVQIAMHLTGLQNKIRQTTLRFGYIDAIEAHFASAREHPAVAMAAKLINTGFIHPKPNRLMLLLGAPPLLPEMFPVARYNEIATPGDNFAVEPLQEWVEHLRSFATETHFMDFAEAWRPFHQKIEDHLASVIRPTLVAELEHYFGDRLGGYGLIGCPLYGNNGISLPVPAPRSCYCIIEIPDREPPEDASTWVPGARLTFGLWHEYGHCFVNHLTYEHMQSVNELKGLMKLHTANWYSWWPAIVNETIIRAIVARSLELHQASGFPELGPGWDRDPCETELQREESMGFPLVRGVYSLLKQYEDNRSQYTTFRDFYPVLLDWLKSEEQKCA